MGPVIAAAALLLVLLCALLCALAYGVGLWFGKRGEPARDWLSTRTRHRKSLRAPTARPLETVVADVRRLGAKYHALDPHASYAKSEAVRAGYDRALAECCAALRLTHLLGVLPSGPELDAERERVEQLLADAGVRLPHAA